MATKAEIISRIRVLSGQTTLDEDEQEELEKLNADLSAIKAKEEAKKLMAQADEDAKAEAAAETQRQINEALKKQADEFAAKQRRLPYSEAPYQAQFSELGKYDSMDPVSLALFIDMQNAFKAQGISWVDGSPVSVNPSATKALAMRIAELKANENTGDAKKNEENRQDLVYIKGSFEDATGIKADAQSVGDAIKAAKTAGDPNYTGGSLVGSDWVGTAYSPELWRSIRQTPAVVGKIPSEVIPDGYSNKTWPLESTDMTWYKVAEASAGDATLGVPATTVTSSQLATANKNITVAKMGARGVYSGEMEEDSLIRFSTQLRTQLEVSGQENLESLVIDGDTEVSANKSINTIASSPGGSEYYLLFDGFRKLALVTNTANSLSASGGLAVEDFLKIMKLMGTAGIGGADPSKVNFIYDGNTHYALSQLPEVKTRDVNSAATVENGFVTKLWGVGGIPSWQMHKASAKRMANTAGKINGTDSSNTTGAALCVRWDQWKLVYKRRMTMEVTRLARSDSWEIVALCRVGLGYRDTEASAILYNIGV